MKNLLVYISNEKKFNEEFSVLIKIQIDNSLMLGWKREDIWVVTNFPYEHNGVKAIVVRDDMFCPMHLMWRESKINVVIHLLEKGIGNEIVWNHDLDAFQLEKITEEELNIKGYDVGTTDFGWVNKWNGGSYFFKQNALDIFKLLKELIHRFEITDEKAWLMLSAANINNIRNREKRLNIAYNIGAKKLEYNYNIAEKPLKVLHFHPKKPGLLDIFMYGNNDFNKPILTASLIKIFNKYGIA